jgi:hypothetical protein
LSDAPPSTVEEALARHGLATVRVATPSMAPTLLVGETVEVRAGAPSLGEVVLLRARGELMVHRLVARLPGLRFVHAGDAPTAQPGLCRAADVLGVAELPCRMPSPQRRAALALRALWGAARARWLVLACALLCVLAGAAACKRKPAAAAPSPGPPEVVEVKVVDRTPPSVGAALDADVLSARAAAALARSSGLHVLADGGAADAARLKLRVEIRLDGAEDQESGKGILRAFVTARLVPVGAPIGALTFEQEAVAEREYALKERGDARQAWRAHAERAVDDVVQTVGARVRLSVGPSEALVRALDGDDADLRDEAIRLAGERRERAAVPSLVKLLKSDDHATRDRAIGALAAIGDARAVRPLTEVARFREVSELPKVLDALSAIGGDEARAYLEFVASGHESAEMRELAKQALTHLDQRRK